MQGSSLNFIGAGSQYLFMRENYGLHKAPSSEGSHCSVDWTTIFLIFTCVVVSLIDSH